MDVDYVDYYGKYEDLDDNDYTFSVSDIHNKQREKDLRRLHVYKSILGKVFKKIKTCASNEESYCFFEVPEYIYGTPLYKMEDCVIFILNNLHDKGFSAKYVDPNLIFICWNIPKPNLRITELPRPGPEYGRARPPGANPNPVYRPIENFQGNGSFFYGGHVGAAGGPGSARASPPSSVPRLTNGDDHQASYRETSTFGRMMAAAPATFSRPQYRPMNQQQHSPADRNMLFTQFSNTR
jgi:Family of unknown function (DUF5759)